MTIFRIVLLKIGIIWLNLKLLLNQNLFLCRNIPRTSWKLLLIVFDFFTPLPNDCIYQGGSKKIHNLGSEHSFCLCTLHARLTHCAWGVHLHSIYRVHRSQAICLSESAWQMQAFGSILKKIGDDFWERKNIFSSNGPPLVFGYLFDSVLADPGVKF